MSVRRFVASSGRKRICRIRYIALCVLLLTSYFGLYLTDVGRWTTSEEEIVRYFERDRTYFYLRDVDLKSPRAGDVNVVNIFTSYRDARLNSSEPVIRVLAYSHSKIATTFCCFRVATYTSWICSKRQIRAKVLSSTEIHRTNNGTRHMYELMFICKLYPSYADRWQLFGVALVTIRDNVATRMSENFQISRYNTRGYVRNETSFTVCIIPSGKSNDERFSNVQDILEYGEVLKLLGSSQVVLYYRDNNVISGTFKGIRGISLDRVQLPLNTTHLPTMARNDCVYRSMKSSDYVIFLDLHEILIPTVARDWSAVLDTLRCVHNSTKVGAYVMQVFDFFDETTNGTDSFAISSRVGNSRADQALNKPSIMYLPRLVRFRTREKNASTDNVILGQPMKIDHISGTGSAKMLPGFLHVNVPVKYATVNRFIHGRKKMKGLVIDASKDKFVPTLLRKLHTLGYASG